MNKKDLIILKLDDLKKIYEKNIEKKWNLKALNIAINVIKKYEGNIISGYQLRNELKGIGEKISKRIDEILNTGDLEELKESKLLTNNTINDTTNDTTNDKTNNTINNIDNLLLITGVGLVRAKKWISLNIHNIHDVKEAIKNNKIKSTHHIDIGIKYYEDFQKKIPRYEIDKIKFFLDTILLNIDKKIIYNICGSYRRGLSESGDIDILISHPDYNNNNIENNSFLKKIVKELIKNNFIIDNLTSEGNTKFMGVCKLNGYNIGRRIDIRVINYNSYYTSLVYFTGSKNFNIFLRNKALNKNYSLNEYNLTNLTNNCFEILNSEKDIFDILDIPYILPEERNSF